MSVTQTQQAVGQWSVRLRGNIPKRILDALTYYGHVAVVPGSVSVGEYGDNLLPAARYVGVYRNKSSNDDGVTIGGNGMESWLGDDEAVGDVFETAVTFTNETFVNTITGLLPPGGAITAGAISALPGLYNGSHRWVTPRTAIDYVTQLYGAVWRVNSNGTLDAGLESDLFHTSPRAILMARDDSDDLNYKALRGKANMDRDVEDFTTRVVLLGEGEGDSIATGTADNAYNPYKDIHGNPLVVKRIVSESETTADNADTRAEVILSQYEVERPRVSLSTSKYDIKGDVAVGDYIYVYNPANGFEDVANEVEWQGEVIHPVKLQCIELSWPIVRGWTVAFRDSDGVWTDLSPWVMFEGGDTNVVVGQLPRSLTSSSPPGDRPNLPEAGADFTVPDNPDWIGYSVGAYQSEETNTTKAAIWLNWTTPLNLDSSVIDDGDRYEIRYRVSVPIGYKIRWGQLEPYRWGELEIARWGAPLTAPVSATPQWQTVIVGWGDNEFTLTELTAGVPYELQVRAVDINGNFSAWSSSLNVTTTGDAIPPSTPASPTVAASRIAIQVVHTLGKNSGGTFNLELDLEHLNVHVGGSASFYPDEGNRVGRLIANSGMILAGIPAVGTFQIEPTETIYVKVVAVDRAGNKSSASPGVTVTAELIDDAHISDLTVSKITAGTISAEWLLAGSIKTAETGARAEMTSAGLSLYNSSGVETVELDSASANIRVREGRLEVIDSDDNVIIELGKTSDGRYGLRVNDNTGDAKVRAGQLASEGGYGLEAIAPGGELVELSTLAFGIAADSLFVNDDVTQDTWGDWLSSVGPTIDFNVGTSGKCIVFLSYEHQEFSTDFGYGGLMSFELSGSTHLPPSTLRMVQFGHTDNGFTDAGLTQTSNNLAMWCTNVILLEGLNPGAHRIVGKYQAASSGPGTIIWIGFPTIAVFPF